MRWSGALRHCLDASEPMGEADFDDFAVERDMIEDFEATAYSAEDKAIIEKVQYNLIHSTLSTFVVSSIDSACMSNNLIDFP